MKYMSYVIQFGEAYVCVDVWSGETVFYREIDNATYCHSRSMAHAVICDVKREYPGRYTILEVCRD